MLSQTKECDDCLGSSSDQTKRLSFTTDDEVRLLSRRHRMSESDASDVTGVLETTKSFVGEQTGKSSFYS